MIIKRVFAAAGTNRQFINGSATTLNVLKELGDGLVDLHGPHDHQSLLSVERQLDLLDSFAGAEALREKYGQQYRALNCAIAEHDELAGSEAALEREVDLLRHQVTEIEAANLRPDEEEDTVARYHTVSNGRRLLELAGGAIGRLSESDDAAIVRLNEVGKVLRDLERIDLGAKRFSDLLLRGLAEMDELASALSHYAEDLDIEPAALAELEERVSLFETLKRKYGATLAEVIAFGDEAAGRLLKIETRGEELKRLKSQIEMHRKAMSETAVKLTAKRKGAVARLAAAVTGHLRDLGFKKSDFSIELAPSKAAGPSGMESVEFVFAPNPGEPAKPLKAIASSGEISRVMLAVKSALATQDTIALLVFDEIDANVGGEIAHSVGAKMKAVAAERQVLAITHLPQVAASARAQFVVTKDFSSGRTVSTLTEVEGEDRAAEIARMLGGKGASALAHAKTLLAV